MRGKKQRTIGIITFHRADNFGAVLQSMCLRKKVAELVPNDQVCVIDYRNRYLEEPYKKFVLRYKASSLYKYIEFWIKGKMKYVLKYKDISRRRAKFDDFRRDFLNMTDSYADNQMSLLADKFDIAITGSDQVWNSKITGTSDDKAYTLDFMQNGKKVSYAASAGSSKMIGEGTLTRIGKLDSISVREAELKDFLCKKLGVPVRIDIDPVFLLKADEWENLLPRKRTVKQKYVFAYCVTDKSKEVAKIANEIAKDIDAKIIYVNYAEKYGSRGECHYAIGPMEFVDLLKNAEVVVASSFHGTAFSLIFNKQFVAVPGSKVGGRVVNVLQTVGLENRMFNSYEEYKAREKEDVNFDNANKVLEAMRKESIDYLKGIISNN
jgi:hypothetical protein